MSQHALSSTDETFGAFSCPLSVPWRFGHGTGGRPGSREGAGEGAAGGSCRKAMPDLRLKDGEGAADNKLACMCTTHASIASREETHTQVCKLRMPAQLQGDNTHAGVQSLHASTAAW